MGKFILNGKNYCGLIDAQGVFIDTDTIIKAETTVQANTTATYTATQDCCVRVKLRCASGVASSIRIDGVEVGAIYNADMTVYFSVYYLKKGQTITITTSYESSYAVYAIQMGSEVTFLSEYASACYDTNEREVGCWTDGKPLYQKTIDCGALPNNTTKNVNHNVSDVETIFIVNAFGINSSKESYPIPFAHRSTTGNQIQISVDSTKITLGTGGSLWTSLNGFVTIRYTKTTDTAGSGKLTPTATPTVHYTTSEQVIGTWLGQTLYERVFEISEVTVSADSWSEIASIDTSNMGQLVSNKCLLSRNGMEWGLLSTQKSNNNKLNVFNSRNGNIAFDTIVLQYTKSS